MERADILIGSDGFQPSRSIWGPTWWNSIREGSRAGYAQHWNMADLKLSADVAAAVAYWGSGIELFGSTGGSVAVLDVLGGGITIAADGDNEGVGLGMVGKPFQIDRGKKRLAFECRLKTSTITDTKHGIFAGLIDTAALSATVPIAAAGTLADENLVGFHRLEGDGDQLDTVYKANGVAQVTVKADASQLTADTFVNLGLVYHGESTHRDGKYRLSFFVNGEELADTKEIPTGDGTDFPNDVRLGWVIAILNATATTPGSTSIQWVRVAQEF
jgi:hypothetical protein